MARRLAKVAADLLDVENVCIYPGPAYRTVDTDKIITTWMPLVDINVEMGRLTFASGSRKKENVYSYEIAGKSESEFDTYVRGNNFEISHEKTMKAGDATWHTGFTIHNAPDNKSNIMRRGIYHYLYRCKCPYQKARK